MNPAAPTHCNLQDRSGRVALPRAKVNPAAPALKGAEAPERRATRAEVERRAAILGTQYYLRFGTEGDWDISVWDRGRLGYQCLGDWDISLFSKRKRRENDSVTRSYEVTELNVILFSPLGCGLFRADVPT